MEPVNLRAFNPINTGQRFIALAVAVNVGQRDPVVDFLQQAVAFPDEARRDGVARRSSLQQLLAGFTDAAPKRIVAETHLCTRLVTVPWLADHIRQAMLPIIAISPAGMPVIFLSGTAMNVILPADTVQFGGKLIYAPRPYLPSKTFL